MKPRWIIDDTSQPGRIFCEHTQKPRLIGELLDGDHVREDDFAMAAPNGLWVAEIRWLGKTSVYEEQDMYESLDEALKAHHAAKQPVAATI